MVEADVSRKRPAANSEHEVDQRMSKQYRLETTIIPNAPQNFIPQFTSASSRKGNHFLLVHMQMLRALYGPTAHIEQAVTDPAESTAKEEDGALTEYHFQTIQKFLKERQTLRSLADKVKQCQGIEEEALKFVKEEKDIVSAMTPSTASNSHDKVRRTTFSTRTSSLFDTGQQSPYPQNRFFPRSHRNDQLESNHGSLNLMAVLLKRKYLIADQTLKRQTSPFRSLLQDVRRRVTRIDALLAKHNESAPDLQNNSVISIPDGTLSGHSGEAVEDIARLETKLRLWTLLLLDLESTA
jgi:hypothetical protein